MYSYQGVPGNIFRRRNRFARFQEFELFILRVQELQNTYFMVL
jgi:hypothetical protein